VTQPDEATRPPANHLPRSHEDFPNILTVDLEDWFHICDVEALLPKGRWDALPSTVVPDTEKVLELVGRAGARATFFVLGYVAVRHPDLIRRISALGHEIAYHGWDHELVYDLTPKEFRGILRKGVATIEDLVGSRPIGFRAPQWSINNRSLWALKILAEEGFAYDSSMAPLKIIGDESYPLHPHGKTLGTGRLWEFPPLTLWTPWGRFPAAGGWGLRSLPMVILDRTVQSLNQKNIPAVFYIHPREIGSNRSIPGLPLSKRFALNAGLWSSRVQVEELLRSFRFTSIARFLTQRSGA
jgi:peptidoglycan-N-acetylglucosamine deacetylase